MTAVMFVVPSPQITDGAAVSVVPGAKLYFYRTGTLNTAPVYLDADLVTLASSPVVADALGRVAPIYMDASITYRAVIKSSGGVELADYDPYTSEFTADAFTASETVITLASSMMAAAIAAAATAGAAAAIAAVGILTTSGAPSSGTGANGQFAYDPTARMMYGPKASGAWPAGISLIGGPGTPGINGGVGSSAGFAALFSAAAGMEIAAGIKVFRTAGYSIDGIGGAYYLYDAAVDAAYVTAHPRLSFLAADGRGFRLSPAQDLTVEMAGGIADSPLPTLYYKGSNYTGVETAPLGTDSSDALDALVAYTGLRPLSTANANGAMRPIGWECNDNNKCYHLSRDFIPTNTCSLNGAGSGLNPGAGTFIRMGAGCRGVVFNGESTQPGSTIVDGHWTKYPAGGSKLRGLSFFGAGGTDRTKHGLTSNVPIDVEDCAFYNFSGDGIHIVGSGGLSSTNPLYGNSSGSYFNNVFVGDVGGRGAYVNGSDTSASYFRIRVKSCRLSAIQDESYYHNEWHVEIDDYADGLVGACQSGGYAWMLVSITPGAGSAVAPGDDSTVWRCLGVLASPTTYYPAYNSANTYEMSAAIYLSGVGSVVTGYVENFYLQSIMVNGAECKSTEIALVPESAFSGGLPTGGGVVSGPVHQVYRRFIPDDPVVGSKVSFTAGGSGTTIYSHARANEGGLEYQYSYLTGGIVLNYGGIGSGYGPILFYSTLNSDKTFGRAAAVTHVFEPQTLSIGDGSGNVGTGRIFTVGTTAPTGDHASGEVQFNKTPATGGNLALVCYTGHATTPTFYKAGTIFIDAFKTYDPPSLATAATTTTTVTCTGAALGDIAKTSFSLDLQGIFATAYVSSANTVTVVLLNLTGGTIDLGSGTLRVRVEKV